MRIIQKATMVLGVTASLAAGTIANAQSVLFTGSTTGCFTSVANFAGPNPCPATGAPIANDAGLSFSTGSFHVTTVNGYAAVGNGGPVVGNFGTFDLAGAPYSYTGDTFRLFITFTNPTGTSPNPATFGSELYGTVVATGTGGATVCFQASTDHTSPCYGIGGPENGSGIFTSDAGTFSVNVSNTNITGGAVNVPITGSFFVTTTPEPSSLALLGTGLIGLVPMVRRRRK